MSETNLPSARSIYITCVGECSRLLNAQFDNFSLETIEDDVQQTNETLRLFFMPLN